MKKICTWLLILAMLLTMLPMSAFAASRRIDGQIAKVNAEETAAESNGEAAATAADFVKNANVKVFDDENTCEPDTLVDIIVLLDDAQLPESGLPTKAAKAKMLQQQTAVQNAISKDVLAGEKLQVKHSYTTLTNGFSATVTYAQLQQVRNVEGVVSAFIAPTFEVSPQMSNSNSMVGGGLYNQTAYHGEGMVIAILDTGVELRHEIFAGAPDSPRLTQADIQAALSENDMQCESYVSGVGASTLYYSAKIPFQFDYGDGDTDGNPTSGGEHGTHVAATAAGNDGVVEDVVGVAPEAQILNMKVFRTSGGASYDDILAALEDCMILGVDVVNLSLGSTAGFIDYESQDEWTMNLIDVFNRTGESGIAMAVAVGNDYSAAYNNNYGGKALASNPDYGNASEPATYDESLAVAAVENNAMVSPYITVGGKNIAYYDGYDGETQAVTQTYQLRNIAFMGSLEYVMVGGYGVTEDYAGLDLTGKIAVVSRGGGVTYEEKARCAAAAGALAIIVYNNVPGMVYMSISDWKIPMGFISQADGQYLAEQTDKHLTIAKEDALVSSPTAGMCDFTSWGATSELTLKPEITAPGGNIYSAVPGGYELMSGTSMASPHVAGGMALVMQALKAENTGLDAEALKDLADTRLMSTAAILYEGETPYSPRRQGAGLMNINAAIESSGYITVPGMERPKLELGDDVQRTGVYTLNFTVHNTGSEDMYYQAAPIVLTDATTDYAGSTVMAESDVYLGHTFTTNYPNNLVKVPAGGTADVTMTITLTDPEKELAAFENGAYVEGWATLKAVNADGSAKQGGYDLSAPFLAFYGDWTEAPIIDSGFWWEEIANETTDAQTYANEAILSSQEGYTYTYLGDNNYDYTVPYLADRNAISPNGDDFMDSLTYVYTGLLRSARTFTYTITGEDGTVYYEKSIDYEIKSMYDSDYYSVVPAGAISDYGDCIDPWYGTDKNGSSLPNNTKATVTVSATPVYDAHPSNNKRDSWSFPITIDTEDPEVLDMTVRESEGRYYATIRVRDNQYVAAVVFTDSKFSKEFNVFGVGETAPGQTTVIEDFDITGFGENIGIIVDDYAGNSKTYYLKATGNSDDYADVVVTEDMILYKEDFNDQWLPEGWETKSESRSPKTWYRDEYYWAAIDYDELYEQNEWLITRPYDLSGQSTPTHMIFNFETSYTFCVQYPHFNVDVYVSADDGETWESIWNLRESGLYSDWTATQAKVVIPDEYQGRDNVRFAFVYTGDTGGAQFAMDNVIIYKDRAEDYIAVTATAGEHGAISPAGRTLVKKGNSKTFTAVPDEGYEVAAMIVDGKDLGPISYYTFELVGVDHTIEAKFQPATSTDSYTILAEATEGGTITPAGTISVKSGESQSFAVAPLNGYYLVSLRVNGRSVGKLTQYTLENVNQNYYVQAGFEPIPATPDVIFEQDFEDAQFPPEGWSVKGTSNTWKQYSYYYLNNTKNAYVTNGTGAQDEYLISPAVSLRGATETNLEFDYAYPYYGMKNGQFTFTLEASTDGTNWTTIWDARDTLSDTLTGYVIVDRAFVTVPEEFCTDGVSFAWHFTRPATSDVGIAAIDNIKLEAVGVSTDIEGYAKITATAGEGGAITPAGRTYVEEGTDKTFAVTPVVGYVIDDVLVDGKSVGAVDTYTFEKVYGTHTIHATFKLAPLPDGKLFENDFEDETFPSRGWSVKGDSTGNYTWYQGAFSYLNDTKAAVVDNHYEDWSNAPAQDEWLISPTVDLQGKTPTLEFDVSIGRYELFTQKSIDLLVHISTDGGETWNQLWSAQAALTNNGGYYTTESVSIDIPAMYCKDNVKIAFEYAKKKGWEGDKAAVDNVKLSSPTDECSHENTELRNAVEPTCTSDGYTGDTYCTDCGNLIAAGTVMPALSHDFGQWTQSKAATCTEAGEETRTCARCGATETREIAALGHDYVQTVTESTCTEQGYTTHKCSRCDDTYVDSYTDALGHDFGEWAENKAATCTEGGEETRSCSRCDVTETRQTEALGHDWGDWTVTKEATEDTTGEETRTCTRCDATETRPTDMLDCPSEKFEDVDQSLWYHSAIDYALVNHIFAGIDETHFGPNVATTRAMFVAVLWRLEGRPEAAEAAGFEDVPATEYYAAAVAWAAENKIVAGVDDTHFNPKDNVTREQVAAFLYRYARAKGYDLTADADLSQYPDSDKVEPYARTNLSWAVSHGLITGSADKEGTVYLDPKGNATRAQVARILMMFEKNFAE